MKCKMDDCRWEGYVDTGMCWSHSLGEEAEPAPKTLPFDDDSPNTFAEEVFLAKHSKKAWAEGWEVVCRRRS